MPIPDFAEHLDAAPVSMGANESFLLDDMKRVVFVREGSLDLFVVEVDAQGHPVSRMPYVARLPAGSVCFGTPRLPILEAEHYRGVPKGDFSLLAVPAQNTVIVEEQLVRFLSADEHILDKVILVDEWVQNLGQLPGRHGLLPPVDAHLLDADPDVPYPRGAVVTAHHSDLIWFTANRPTRFMGQQTFIIAPGRTLPLSERGWLQLDEDTEISASHTPAALLGNRLRFALLYNNMLTIRLGAILWTNHVSMMRRRLQANRAAKDTSANRMFHDLGDVLGKGNAGIAPVANATSDAVALHTATKLVAESSGAVFSPPAAAGVDTRTGKEALVALARRADIRTREITLGHRWWRLDGPSFVANDVENGQPLAVLADGRGRYRSLDPTSRGTFEVDAGNAARIGHKGMMLYPPLPESVKTGLAALRHTLRGRWRDFRVVVLMSVLAALLALLTPELTGKLLAEVIPRVDTPQWVAMLGALFLAALGTAMFDIVRALATLRIEGRIDEQLQAAVWSRLVSLPMPFFRRYTSGDLADRANGITMIRQMLTGATVTSVLGGVFSLFSFALLFYYSWSLALWIGASALLILVGATWFFTKGQMRHHRAAFEVQGRIDGFVFQMLSGISKLRMANAERFALANWAERFAEQRRETLAARRWAAGQMTFGTVFSPIATLAIFAFIWYQLIAAEKQPDFDLVVFLSFHAAFGQFIAGVTGLAMAWTTVVSAIPLFERVQPIIDARPEMAGRGISPADLAGEIEFANVSFRYLPDLPHALDDISFRIGSNDYVAFVGASGSGKSTIYRLLLGFEQPTSGAVLVDGHDLESLDLPSLRTRMGVVLQNGQLMPASIYKNIAVASPLTMDEAWEAARAAGLEEDIRDMPMEMHTLIPEGGSGLSGGQRQRLLIARALARKPRILLLDEATSALDNRTQAIVQESLRELNITRVVIAHRLSTVQDADRIYVLEGGRIVESGGYDHLMRREGVFADLARRQLV